MWIICDCFKTLCSDVCVSVFFVVLLNRTFRAKLVHQETAEHNVGATEHQDGSARNDERASSKSNVAPTASQSEREDSELKKQQHFSKLFSGAISSIFRFGGNNNISSEEGIRQVMMSGAINDPFADENEIPALICDSYLEQSFDRHRWAHALDHIEPGCVLVANEKLGGVFHQTVVLIIEHDDKEGSTGIVINRPLPGSLIDISGGTESHIDIGLRTAFNGSKVSYGGPVMQDEYSVLHGWGHVEGSKKVSPGIFVGGSSELAFEVRKNNFDPADALFIKGHAAWIPNQLNREVKRGVWYVASVSSDFILRYAGAPTSEHDNSDDLWADILTALGGNFKQVAKSYAGPGDRRMNKQKP